MTSEALERAFEKMGATVRISTDEPRWPQMRVVGNRVERGVGVLTLNTSDDGKGFFIRNTIGAELEVLNIEPKDRHLLLLSREGKEKHRYLLGHDERHWFVAAIPESSPVSTVRQAKDALKPQEVLHKHAVVRAKSRQKRRTAGWVRQGEWFFTPCPDLVIESSFETPVLYNEPIRMGRKSPHLCQELYRSGGETVYVAGGYPNGLTEKQYHDLDKKVRESRNWQIMKRGMDVWVRGTVKHGDHKTIHLPYWHKVSSNTEHLSDAGQRVVFLD